jgi:Mce-associated membrane protein
MRSRKRLRPALNGDPVGDSPMEGESAAADALTLAEEAEAEAAEAEAVAAAARARARAIRLRREAEAAKATPTAEASDPHAAVDEPDPDETDYEISQSDTAVEEVTEEPAAKRRRLRLPRPRLKVVAAVAAILAICALLAASGYMTWFNRQTLAEQRLRAEFSAAARTNVVTLMSLDYNKANEDVQRIIDSSTGQFKQDFEAQRDNFVQVAVDSKAVTETNVTATAVDSVTDDTGVVLVAAASRVTNAAGAKQEPRSWRLAVSLAREGGQIKMARVEFVP